MSKANRDFFKKKKEWSKTKDAILGCYLRPYFSKILISQKELCYIDCFAGKGKFDDGENGSPLIALNILNDSINISINRKCPSIKCYFIELEYGLDLVNNLSDINDIDFKNVISGRFEDEIDNILIKHNNNNIFMYVDPYGIKALNPEKFCSFLNNTKNIEMLINVNTYGILREACRIRNVQLFDCSSNDEYIEEYDESTNLQADEMNKIVGSSDWTNIVDNYKEDRNTIKAENDLSNLIKKSYGKYTYVLNMPIYKNYSTNKVPKYRLYHLTNHVDGCNLMADTMYQRFKDAQISQDKGQESLFNYSCNRDFVDNEKIKNDLLSIITSSKKRLNVICAEYFSSFGINCNSSFLKSIIKEFENSRLIKIERKPSKTTKGKATTFMADNNKRSVTVWR